MTNHKMTYETDRWYCPTCDREVVYDSDNDEWVTLNKGDQSVDHTKIVSPPGLELSVGADTPQPVSDIFTDYLEELE